MTLQPTPADRDPGHRDPGRAETLGPTLVYDGDCGFCRRCAAWIRTRLPAGVSLVSSQQADLALLGLSAQQAADAAWWISSNGDRYRGHRAVAASLQACGGAWGRLGRGLTWPGISLLAAGVYKLIARNRNRLGCKNCLRKTIRGGPALLD